jgi:hypothetical protein
MQNRRQSYRPIFGRDEGIRVELDVDGLPAKWSGDLVDLSLGGLRVRLGQNDTLSRYQGPVTARFHLPGGRVLLTFQAIVTHCRRGEESCLLGIRFLPLSDRKAEAARSKLLWRFLLDKQRQASTGEPEVPAEAPHLTIYRPPEEPEV